jgi:cyclopropane fatty-acyl-phospholipid synthase-like methyltransferase
MNKFLNVIKWGLTLGKEPQNFLGARWIEKFLAKIPASKKRLWALRFVSMSPHYFISENPEYRRMTQEKALEASFEEVKISRVNIFEKLLKAHLERNFTVLDYGCGPGFIAKIAAGYVKKVYAIDISSGAVACAKIINAAENIEYLKADAKNLEKIPDESVDAVYSYAVVQHVTDEVLNIILANCRRKLKTGGKLLLHIQMPNEIWKSQKDWEKDNSLKGKLKYNYGLHCFGRTAEEYCEMAKKQGFADFQLEKFKGFDAQYTEELEFQRLLIAYKND